MFRNYMLFGLLALVGCGTAPDAQSDEETSEEALATWTKLAGAWAGQGGGGIQALVLERTPDVHGHHFFADVDNGIRCIKAPCPSTSRVEGYYTSTTKNLWLHVTSGSSGIDYSGKYGYEFAYLNGKYLELAKDGDTQSLKYVDTYCTGADDCAEQDFVHILCVGHYTCNKNHCGYACGVQQPIKCGTKTCGAGTYCCNPIMSICAPNGGYCIQ